MINNELPSPENTIANLELQPTAQERDGSKKSLGELQSTLSLGSTSNIGQPENSAHSNIIPSTNKSKHHRRKHSRKSKSSRVNDYEQLQTPTSVRVRSPTTRDVVAIDANDLQPFEFTGAEPLVDQQSFSRSPSMSTFRASQFNLSSNSKPEMAHVPTVYIEDGRGFKRTPSTMFPLNNQPTIPVWPAAEAASEPIPQRKTIFPTSSAEQKAIDKALFFEDWVSASFVLATLIFGGMCVLQLGLLPYSVLASYSPSTNSTQSSSLISYAQVAQIVSRLFTAASTLSVLNCANLLFPRSLLSKESVGLRYSRIGHVQLLLEHLSAKYQSIAKIFYPRVVASTALARCNFALLLFVALLTYILTLVILTIDDKFYSSLSGYGPYPSVTDNSAKSDWQIWIILTIIRNAAGIVLLFSYSYHFHQTSKERQLRLLDLLL